MNTTREIKVGIKLDEIHGVQLFGTDEINALISKGWKVKMLEPGGAIFRKNLGASNHTKLVLVGCEMQVILELEDLLAETHDFSKSGVERV